MSSDQHHGSATAEVAAIIVTFYPDRQLILSLIRSLASQVSQILIIDNASEDWLGILVQRERIPSIQLIPQPSNIGVSQAINAGIDRAAETGSSHIILFDQDSIPRDGLVDRLIGVMREKEAEGVKVAAVGPRYIDPRSKNPPPFIRIEKLKLVRELCKNEKVVPVDYLITSGSFISMEVLREVGGMEPHLFIDYIDIEWGLRAKAKGYQCYGVCDAFMEHALGDNPLTFFGRKFPVRSPLRHYYHFRNAVWLYKQPWVPRNWKIVDGFKLIRKYVAYSLLAKPRLKHWWMMSLGLWHGLIGRMGMYREFDYGRK